MSDKNVDKSIILPILKQIPLFAELNEEAHREIIEHIVLMYYPTDYVIFNEGDEGDALYILKKGQVKVYHPKEDEFIDEVAEISGGGFFGEMALVSEEPRNASVKASTDCEIFILSKQDFKKLLDTNTNLAEQISAAVISRLKENNRPGQ